MAESGAFPPRTPWKRVAAALRAALDGMEPGDPLPSLAELSAAHRVNRKTAAKAFAALTAEGLIELRPGRGYYAREAADARKPPPGEGEGS